MLLSRSVALAFSASSIGLAMVFRTARRLIDDTADRRCRILINGPFPMEYSLSSSSDLIEQKFNRDVTYFIYFYIYNIFSKKTICE